MNEQEEQLSPEEEHAKLFEALEGKTDEQPKAVEPKVEAKEEPEPEQEADEPFAGFNSLPEETRELVLQ